MMLETLLTDNPLITKHLRTRLRKRDLLTPAAIVALVCMFVYLQEPKGRIFALLAVQGVLLFIIGTYQVESAVNRARVARLLDFHRFSPLSPLTVVLGFLFGAPVREWLLAAVVVPFELSQLPASGMSVDTFALLVASMTVCAVLYHLLGLVMALAASGSRVTSAGTIVVLVLQFFWLVPPFSYLTMGPAGRLALIGEGGWPLSPALATEDVVRALTHQGVLIVFLLIGALRKMRREDAHFTSKLGGLLFFAIFCVLALADLGQIEKKVDTISIVYLYPVVALAMAFVASVTPSAREFASGVRRAVRANETTVPRWADAAPTWMPIFGLSAIVVAATSAVQAMCESQQGLPRLLATPGGVSGEAHLGPALIIAIASLVTFACTVQGAELRFGRQHARTYTVLILVLYWIAPVLLGLGGSQAESIRQFMGFSPWVGMGEAFTGASSSMLLIGVHLCVAAYAAWWCWSNEQAVTAAAKAAAH